MKKYVIIDGRMRDIEKNKIKSLGYELIELHSNSLVYDEISSHVDIFCTKINEYLILDKSIYNDIKSKINSDNILIGQAILSCKYPLDIPYNVCSVGEFVIHNFKYTDKTVLSVIEACDLEKINISQGYSNCSIAVIDDKSVIVTDKKIANTLKNKGLDVLYLDYDLDIKLLNGNDYSNMSGFIGGAIARLGKDIIVFGDLGKIDKYGKIKEFIVSKKINIIDFKNLDVIDYGGILEV